MADTKISALSAVTDVIGTDEYVLARAGATKKIDAADMFVADQIAFTPTGTIASTDVQAAIAEVAAEASSGSSELSYVQFTSTVAISTTTPSTATTVVTAGAITFDGSTAAIIEFYSPQVECGSGGAIGIVLYDGSTELGIVARVFSNIIVPVHAVRRLTPSAASHTYSWRAYRDTSNGNVQAGTGAASANMPGFIRISRA